MLLSQGLVKRKSRKLGDPFFSNVQLLLHGDGTNDSTSIIDNSSFNRTVTPFVDAKISTVEKKFGSGSIGFLTGNSYLTIANDGGFAFGTGDFTIEFFINFTGLAQGHIIDFRAANGAYPLIYQLDNRIRFFANSTVLIESSSTVTTGIWYYISVVKNSGTTTLYINGESQGSFNDSINYLSNSTFRIGSSFASQWFLRAYLDELRITKGLARNVSVIPTEPFPNN